MEKEEVLESWNKKKIIIVSIISLILIFGGGFFVLNSKDEKFSLKKVLPTFFKDVKGVTTEGKNDNKKNEVKQPRLSIPLEAVIKEKLDTLKKDVSSLSIEDIASSSPQVRKIVNDLNTLKEYPRNEAKEICKQICSGF